MGGGGVGRGIALPILNLGAGWEWVANATPLLLYALLQRKLDGPQGQPGMDMEKSLAPSEVQTLDPPAHSKLLYHLCYRSP